MAHTVHDINIGGNTIGQISNISAVDGGSVVLARASGEVDAAAQYAGNTEEVTSFTTGDLETLLALNTNTFLTAGLCMVATASEVPWRKRADCATFASGASHPFVSGSNALAILTGLSASAEDENGATAQAEIHWKSTDSLTAPLTGSTGNTLSAAAYVNGWGIGKAFVNSVEVSELQSFSVNPGIQLLKKRQGGGIWPTQIYIERRAPTIELVTENIDAAMTRVGYLTAGGNIDVYFRKRANQATFVADATAEHLRIRGTDGLQRAGAISAADNGNGTATISIAATALSFAGSLAIP